MTNHKDNARNALPETVTTKKLSVRAFGDREYLRAVATRECRIGSLKVETRSAAFADEETRASVNAWLHNAEDVSVVVSSLGSILVSANKNYGRDEITASMTPETTRKLRDMLNALDI